MSIKEEMVFGVEVVGMEKVKAQLAKLKEWSIDLQNKLQRSSQVAGVAAQKFKDSVKKQNDMLVNNTKQLKQVAKAHGSFGRIMQMDQRLWAKFNQEGGARFLPMGAKVANRLRMMTHGLRGFRMEMLGVMFFGMGMQRFFTGLLKPAMEVTGIFELFTVLLQLFFLPIILELLPLFLQMFDFFVNTPEAVKLFVGALAILGIILGFVLFMVGTVALGVGSIIQVFGGMTGVKAAIDTVGLAISAFGTSVLVILGIVAVFIVGFVLAWKENFGSIQEWVSLMFQGLEEMFAGWMLWITGWWDLIVGIFEGNTDKSLAGVAKIWEGFKTTMTGLGRFILGLLATLGLSLIRAIFGIWKFLFQSLVKIFDWILDRANDLGIDIIDQIVAGIRLAGHKVLDVLKLIIPKKMQDFFFGTENKTPFGPIQQLPEKVKEISEPLAALTDPITELNSTLKGLESGNLSGAPGLNNTTNNSNVNPVFNIDIISQPDSDEIMSKLDTAVSDKLKGLERTRP